MASVSYLMPTSKGYFGHCDFSSVEWEPWQGSERRNTFALGSHELL